MGNTKPIQINQKRFVRLFKDTVVEDSKMRFCFLLGAGASRSSGIQTKNDLALKWFDEIVEDLESSQLEQWVEETGINTENLEYHYKQIVKKRFQFEPEMSDRIIQQQITLAKPEIGYLILAQILEKTRHNLAITCNTDQLLEDALFSTTSNAPLLYTQAPTYDVLHQQNTRPMVCKLQNNSKAARSEHQKQIDIEFLTKTCKTYRPVFIGNDDNKQELMECLSQLSETERQSVFWCTLDVENLSSEITNLLTEKDFIVEIEGFDELMFEIIQSFNSSDSLDGLDMISLNHFQEDHLLSLARNKARHYKELLNAHQDFKNIDVAVPVEATENPPVTENIDNIDQLNDFMGSLEQTDHDKDDDKYKQALISDPNNVTNNIKYAIFLEDCCSDAVKAENYFKTAIRLAPKNENAKVLYAFLLSHHLQSYDEAEIYYSNAFAIAPENIAINILFGVFLHTIRKKFMAAEKYFRAAFKSLENGIEYTDFMKEIRMDYYATEMHYKREIEAIIQT